MEVTNSIDFYQYVSELEEEYPDHEILFHGTTLNSLKAIANEGVFIPQKKNGSDALANHYEPEQFLNYVFFTNDLENAGHYSTLACATQGEYDNGNIETIVGAIIPRQRLLPDLCDATNAKDWVESLQKTRAVSVKGELHLPAANLFLVFVDYDTGEVLYLTTELDGEKAFAKATELEKAYKTIL